MKTLVTLAVFLETFLACSSSNKVFSLSNQRAIDSKTHQKIHINQKDRIARIHNYSSWNGWDAVWDFQKGLFATRLFRTRACVVAPMDARVFPSLEMLHRFQKQKLTKAAPQDAVFLVGKVRVQDVREFGMAIQHFCGPVPTYYASQEQGASLRVLSQGCMNVGIRHLFSAYLCGNTPSC